MTAKKKILEFRGEFGPRVLGYHNLDVEVGLGRFWVKSKIFIFCDLNTTPPRPGPAEKEREVSLDAYFSQKIDFSHTYSWAIRPIFGGSVVLITTTQHPNMGQITQLYVSEKSIF